MVNYEPATQVTRGFGGDGEAYSVFSTTNHNPYKCYGTIFLIIIINRYLKI